MWGKPRPRPWGDPREGPGAVLRVALAASADLRPTWEVTSPFGLGREDLALYGEHKAQLKPSAVTALGAAETGNSNLVLVTGMTPTPLGEGKTVVSIGLGDALNRLARRTMVCIREPPLGPVFGIKGGAAGGGWAQVVSREDINLHFTGDIHALTAAHNLIAAMLDNHIAKGNALGIDVNEVVWKRAIDTNDRALRRTVVGLGGRTGGTPREDGFLLTAASELIAILCLAEDLADLKARISRVIVAYDETGEPVTAGDGARDDDPPPSRDGSVPIRWGLLPPGCDSSHATVGNALTRTPGRTPTSGNPMPRYLEIGRRKSV